MAGLLVVAGLVAGGFFMLGREELGAPVIFEEDPIPFANPERGWMPGSKLPDPRSGPVRLDDTDTAAELAVLATSHRLAYAAVRLDRFGVAGRDFRGAELDAAALAELGRGFARVRGAGIKVVLRFVYNDPRDFPRVIDDDAPKGRMLRHLAALAPVLRDNADVIAFVQAGMVGAWGEWHNSTHCLTVDLGDQPQVVGRCAGARDDPGGARREIVSALLAAVPAERMIQLRTPRLKGELFARATMAAEPFSGALEARIGFHDDCFLSGPDDAGTFNAAYPFDGDERARTQPQAMIEAWRGYVARQTAAVPFGGETCPPPTATPPLPAAAPPSDGAAQPADDRDRDRGARGDCVTALAEARLFHLTYLNDVYYGPLLRRWRDEGCADEMGRRLGYRLVLLDARWSDEVSPGGTFRLRAHVENRGFAPLYNPREVWVVAAARGGGGRRYQARLPIDPRKAWAPGRLMTLDVMLALPADAPAGDYDLFLWLPDPAPALRRRPEYAVRFANLGTWRGSGRDAGMNALTRADRRLVVVSGRSGHGLRRGLPLGSGEP